MPLTRGCRQSDVEEEKTRATPPKSPNIVMVPVSLVNRLLRVALGLRIGTLPVAASVVWTWNAVTLMTAVRLSDEPPLPNLVEFEGGLTSINWMAPTKSALNPVSLAKARNESGVESVPIACMVTGKALATGVTVCRAVAPAAEKVASEIVWPDVTAAVAIVNVADRCPTPPPVRLNVVVPEVVSEGADPKLKPVGSVTTNVDPMASVALAV